jgi:hypothetical protein
MILTFARCGNNAREAVRLYREQFPQRQNHPDHKTILKLIARSRESGQMQPVRRKVGGAPRNVRTVEHEEAVFLSLRKTAPGVFEQFLVKWVYPRVRCREF